MRFATIDTETTGFLEDPTTRVVEVGAAIFEPDGTLVRSIGRLVCPDLLTPEGLDVAWRICGIEEEEIRAAPPPEVVWDELTEFMDGWAYPLWAWNMAFDRPMIKRTFTHDPVAWAGCLMEAFTEVYSSMAGYHAPTDTPRFFTLKRASYLTKVPWRGNAHRAEADAVMTGEIGAGLWSGRFRPPELSSKNHVGPIVPKVKAELPPCGIGPITPKARVQKKPVPILGIGRIKPAPR